MSAIYEIQVIHLGDEHKFAALRVAVAAELIDLGLHRTLNVVVSEAKASAHAPGVSVFLGSVEAKIDPTLREHLNSAARSGVVIFPVVEDLGHFSRDVPAELSAVNGFEWTGTDPARALTRVLFQELGIEDRQRRVFISHKRDDGLGAAERLHDALSHANFTPFIDRFAIGKGERVQDAIADALEDHAFLLLLETPLAHTSEWVFDEVDYALSHTMGTLIVRWPGDVNPVPGSKSLPRVSLSQDDLEVDPHGYEILSEPALDRLIAEIEAAHAYGLVRRRRMLTRSIEEAAMAGGADAVTQLRDWKILVQRGPESAILAVAPRLPTPDDLRLLDQTRCGMDESFDAVLVHSARELRSELVTHLQWVTGSRNLELTPENAIGGRWR